MPDRLQVMRGLRSLISIYSGPVDRIIPHAKTGRADYFGQTVNRSARLMSTTQGGIIVCDQVSG
jgi:hypothetical protein